MSRRGAGLVHGCRALQAASRWTPPVSGAAGAIAIGGDLDGDDGGALAVAADSIAIGADAQANAVGSIAIGARSIADQANTVSVGSAGNERRIVNVAAGVADTDAVNVSQLAAVTGDVSAVQTTVATHTTQISARQATQDLFEGQVDTLFDLRNRDRRDMKQGVAAAMAMASAPMPSAPGRISYVFNGAMFRGEYAFGGSLQYRFNTEAPMAVNLGVSHAGHKITGVRLGVAGEF